ncbi:MAG TPA: type II secretion system protein GspG [Sumerlaeia bacterium]|nr:type II secretion system protein GspG [Sumerlaeia bacterium]
MTRTAGRFSSSRRRRAFSAVEMVAVATIVSILALVIVPMLRKRVQDSKITATKYEMNKLAEIINLAYADTDRYFRLQDLDNGQALDIGGVIDPTTDVPIAYYTNTADRIVYPLSEPERAVLAQKWKGKYAPFHNAMKIADLLTRRPDMISETNGPIFAAAEEDADLYPLDAWGNPYVFFAPETDYRSPVLYSMGPDGMPGGLAAPAAADYERQAEVLGQGDDIEWGF